VIGLVERSFMAILARSIHLIDMGLVQETIMVSKKQTKLKSLKDSWIQVSKLHGP
jgi:hypothetical protein